MNKIINVFIFKSLYDISEFLYYYTKHNDLVLIPNSIY